MLNLQCFLLPIKNNKCLPRQDVRVLLEYLDNWLVLQKDFLRLGSYKKIFSRRYPKGWNFSKSDFHLYARWQRIANEAKAHQDEVNFISQRITASTSVPLTGNDGMPIRNESAVRAIIKAATDMRAELDSVI